MKVKELIKKLSALNGDTNVSVGIIDTGVDITPDNVRLGDTALVECVGEYMGSITIVAGLPDSYAR